MIPQIDKGTTLLEFFRQLIQGYPPVTGKQISCTFAVGDGTSKSFLHGLGRPLRGAYVVANSAASTTQAWVGAPGTSNVELHLSSAADVTISVWVY